MNFRMKPFIIGCALVVIGQIIFIQLRKSREAAAGPTIGILQTITHPAFDRAREGLVQELHRQLGNQCTVVIQNAEGSMATAQVIAKSFHNNPSITTLVTLGTLATQAASKVETQKPIIFCAVTDPVKLGIIGPTSNVCGVSDITDISTSAQTLAALCPQAKHVAMLFNPAEANSVSLVQKMDAALRLINISALSIGVNNEAEIPSAVAIAIRKADVLWIPTDNTLANAMSMIGRLAFTAKKPLFICDNLLVTSGVLASAGGINYTKCGQQAAQLAAKVIKEKLKPASLGVVTMPSTTIVIHKQTSELLDIQVPNHLLSLLVWANE